MFDYAHYRKNFLKQRHYIQLIANLKVMIESSQAEIMDLTQGRDLLICMGCGAKEKNDAGLSPSKASQESEDASLESFIIIEAKQKIICSAGNPQKLNIYSYICPVCGLYQNGLVRCNAD